MRTPVNRSSASSEALHRSKAQIRVLSAGSVLAGLVLAQSAWAACTPLLNKTFPRLQDDAPQSLCQFQGQVLLVVNTASYCGFTQQYEGLEALQRQYGAKGFTVLGFPSNDFGNQEPGTNQQISEFCTNTFAVKFPMFAKTSVKGPLANPLFRELARQSDAPGWNFHKYLIDKEGRLVRSYASQVAPNSQRLKSDIEGLIAKAPTPSSDVTRKATP